MNKPQETITIVGEQPEKRNCTSALGKQIIVCTSPCSKSVRQCAIRATQLLLWYWVSVGYIDTKPRHN
jgi:hypothetical protein